MCDHWHNFFWAAINDLMMAKYSRLLLIFLKICLYEYYPQRYVRFVNFFVNSSDQTIFSNDPWLHVHYLLLVISLFFKVCISPKYCKFVLVPGLSYGTWNSLLVTAFANKHDYIINNEWRQETTSFRLQELF